MIKNIFVIGGLIVFFAASPGFAQWGGAQSRRNAPVSDSPCWTKAYLEATPQQLKSLENLHRSFYKEISALRNQHRNLSYELYGLLDEPKPDAKMILEKQNQLSGIQKRMDEISIQYLLKARGLFTQDQFSRLPSGCNLGFNYGQRKGQGRGMGLRDRF